MDAVKTAFYNVGLYQPSSNQGIAINKSRFAPGEIIIVIVYGITPTMVNERAWVSPYQIGAGHNQWTNWSVLNRIGTQTVMVTAPRTPGAYEVRLYQDYMRWDDATFLGSVPFTVR
jgi:hypothetical protein